MKKYKFITIEKVVQDIKHWRIKNKRSGDLIGHIQYYQTWRKYIFWGVDGSVWSVDCLEDVIDFIKNEIPK